MEKERFKKISGWASLIRNTTAIVASLISFVTLIILIRQNERTYRPDLVFAPDQTLFSVAYAESPSNCGDIEFRVEHDSVIHELSLTASNLGLGAAKDLHLLWQYDASRLVDTVRIGGVQIPTGAHYVADANAFLFNNCYRKEDNEAFVEYCLPVTSEKTPVHVALPYSYLEMWCNVLIRIGHSLNLSKSQYSNLLLQFAGTCQYLTLKTDYHDINNQPHTKSYAVRLMPRFIDLQKKEMVMTLALQELGRAKLPRRKYMISVLNPDGILWEVPVEL